MRTIKNLAPYIFLFVIECVLFALNYVPGTYFLGWDNLFPEMNFPENIWRSFFAIWQEYRGLGLLDGMSFAANLPHYLFLWMTSLFLPSNLIRYFFVFFMHILGGVGMYKLLVYLLKVKTDKKYTWLYPLFGALFYQFNLATVQMFYAPYELFLVHYAMLPFLVLYTKRFLETGQRKNLLFLGLFSVLAIPQAHVPTIFIVSFFVYAMILIFNLVQKGKTGLLNVFIIVALQFCVNAYWGLPYMYSTVKNASVIANSKINQMATEDIYLKNKAFGNFSNVVQMKGYQFGVEESQITDKKELMMGIWSSHTNTVAFKVIAVIFFIGGLTGGIFIIRSKNRTLYPFVVFFVIAFGMLGTNIPMLSSVTGIFYDYIPFFKQIFRFVFTKFAILYGFSLSILLTYGLLLVVDKFGQRVRIAFGCLLFACLLYYTLPSWQGYFLYPALRVSVPTEYFDTVNFFNKQERDERVALLPQVDFWDWTHTNWGYRGSGFLWYGIRQPSLDGAFYPWSKTNENYYWEMSYALYSQNKSLLEKVLEKYSIRWVLVDESATYSTSPKSLYFDKITSLLQSSKMINRQIDFGKIHIYRVNLPNQEYHFVSMTAALQVEPSYLWSNYDDAYYHNGIYYNFPNNDVRDFQSNAMYYPFRSLFTGKQQSDQTITIENQNSTYIFKASIGEKIRTWDLFSPNYQNEVVEIMSDALSTIKVLEPTINLDENTVSVVVPKAQGIYSYDSQQDSDLKTNSIYLPLLAHKYSYLIALQTQYKGGKPTLFWLENLNSKRTDISTYLSRDKNIHWEYYIQPPMEEFGTGYTLHFENFPQGNRIISNSVSKVVIVPIPYYFLNSLHFSSEIVKDNTTTGKTVSIQHSNPSSYSVKLKKPDSNEEVLILSQSYDNGWHAYAIQNSDLPDGKAGSGIQNWLNNTFPFFFGEELTNHVLVNNWENGWVINNDKLQSSNDKIQIQIIYLPQYLEYIGFGLLMGAVIMLLLYPSRRKHARVR